MRQKFPLFRKIAYYLQLHIHVIANVNDSLTQPNVDISRYYPFNRLQFRSHATMENQAPESRGGRSTFVQGAEHREVFFIKADFSWVIERMIHRSRKGLFSFPVRSKSLEFLYGSIGFPYANRNVPPVLLDRRLHLRNTLYKLGRLDQGEGIEKGRNGKQGGREELKKKKKKERRLADVLVR